MSNTPVYSLSEIPLPEEIERLNGNHRIFTRLTKTTLPDIVRLHVASLPAPAVADVGTGTGVWLIDLAKELPETARLDGFDVDTSKFHPPADRPANMTLQAGDVLLGWPAKLHGQYDLIHVRLLFYALKKEEWRLAVENLKPLLKPGGWLLWEEAAYLGWNCIPMSDSFHRWARVEMAHAEHLGRDVLCVDPHANPPQLLTRCGEARREPFSKQFLTWASLAVLIRDSAPSSWTKRVGKSAAWVLYSLANTT
jgi:SAM-dependent methyltransferase